MKLLKLARMSVLSSVAGWAWQNRATIIAKVQDLTGSNKAPTPPATGYAKTAEAMDVTNNA